MDHYDLSDFEWSVIKPLLPNKPRGVPRVDDRCVLDGIMWMLRSGSHLARPAGTLRALHHLLQPLQSLAQEGHLGSPDGRDRRGLRAARRGDRHPRHRHAGRGRPARGGDGGALRPAPVAPGGPEEFEERLKRMNGRGPGEESPVLDVLHPSSSPRPMRRMHHGPPD